jgi:hypothetical protein
LQILNAKLEIFYSYYFCMKQENEGSSTVRGFIFCTHPPNIIRQIKLRRMRWAGHVARMREERDVYKVLMGKPEGKRPLGRPRRRRDQNGS